MCKKKKALQNEKKELIAVTNRHLCEGDFFAQVERIAEAGFDRIILREKDLNQAEYKKLAEQVLKKTEPYGTICTLHHYLEVAVELQVKQVHLPLSVAEPLFFGQEKEKLELLLKMREIGFSIHSLEQLKQVHKMQEILQKSKEKMPENPQDILQKQTALQEKTAACTEYGQERQKCSSFDIKCYVTAGHIFPTDCKKGLPPKGLAFLQEISQEANVKVYALGGINPENMMEIKKTGADGVCLMSYCMRASAQELQKLVSSWGSSRRTTGCVPHELQIASFSSDFFRKNLTDNC